ncbi:MAG: hydroxymethylglutaryl-CoA reductase [Gammaproteobacteria bacterium]
MNWHDGSNPNRLLQKTIIPLSTFEAPLWPSCQRGARITRLLQDSGLQIMVLKDAMVRSIVLEAPDLAAAVLFKNALSQDPSTETAIHQAIQSTGRFVRLSPNGLHCEILGNLIYIRFSMETGDAAGHNMVTKASDKVMQVLLQRFPHLKYVSISANYCTDKKVSAINGILGRGKHVIAEALIPGAVCEKYLGSNPETLANLHLKKNLLGSLLAGSLRSANAHVANMLLAFYLATGQDAANIVEGSQAIVRAEVKGEDLYFMVSLPNIILGTVGNGKNLDFVQENLKLMDCVVQPENPGASARRLACIAGGLVWCGELSLLAAQAKPGELVKSHMHLER